MKKVQNTEKLSNNNDNAIKGWLQIRINLKEVYADYQ